MSNYADLVKRLRDLHANCRRWVYESGLGNGHEPSRLLRESRDRLDEAASAISALTQKLEEAREALEPFAEIARELSPILKDSDKNGMHWAIPTCGQIRACAALHARLSRAALSEPRNERQDELGGERPADGEPDAGEGPLKGEG